MSSKYQALVFDLATTFGFIFLTSLLFEYLKPGLISNTFDINLVLSIFLVLLIACLFLKAPNYRFLAVAKLVYGLWGLLILGIFVKVALSLTTDTTVYLVILTSAIGLFWLLVFYYLTKK